MGSVGLLGPPLAVLVAAAPPAEELSRAVGEAELGGRERLGCRAVGDGGG